MADYQKLVQNKKWKRLARLGRSKKLAVVDEVAAACGTAKSEEAHNILVDILSRPEREAQLAAVKGLGSLRHDIGSQITRLIWLKDRIDESDTELAETIDKALSQLHEAKVR